MVLLLYQITAMFIYEQWLRSPVFVSQNESILKP